MVSIKTSSVGNSIKCNCFADITEGDWKSSHFAPAFEQEGTSPISRGTGDVISSEQSLDVEEVLISITNILPVAVPLLNSVNY